MTDQPPSGLLMSTPVTGSTGWTCSNGFGGLTSCTTSTSLPIGYSATFIVISEVTAAPGTSLKNCANVSNQGDPNATNNQSCVTLIVIAPRPPVPRPATGPSTADASVTTTIAVRPAGSPAPVARVQPDNTVPTTTSVQAPSEPARPARADALASGEGTGEGAKPACPSLDKERLGKGSVRAGPTSVRELFWLVRRTSSSWRDDPGARRSLRRSRPRLSAPALATLAGSHPRLFHSLLTLVRLRPTIGSRYTTPVVSGP